MITDLEAANATAREVRFATSCARARPFTNSPRKWNDLAQPDHRRAGHRRRQDQFGPQDYEAVMPHVGEAHAALCELLVSLAEMIEKNKTEGPDQEVWDRFHKAQREALACLKAREAERDSINERAIQTPLFGLEEIRRVVSEFRYWQPRAGR